jgi:hypothetical protein
VPVAPDTAFVLPADVVLLRPDEVDADVRADAGLTGGDRVLVRRGSRHAPKAVSAELAVLLEQFRTPTTLADGVVSVAVAAAVDAEVMLVEAFPALVELSRTDPTPGGRPPPRRRSPPTTGSSRASGWGTASSLRRCGSCATARSGAAGTPMAGSWRSSC